ncbi:hypothetical protein HG536_0G03760 [Torulaspora globosa]|uniref:Chloride channel protein n=1 Tax=Torulaspora globosa TaxID=48254 RepID=A0A7G3ZLX8_9SACH|nr:uncharacterized protein HG536_0G03760 [Torulaspora globosa]QLL34514.1 hypothetical protein HG536_0G03760 [Torulaspora globosa]
MSGAYSRLGKGDDGRNRFENIAETQNFDSFVTIDLVSEENTPISGKYGDRYDFGVRFRRLRKLIWDRCSTVVTLTLIAVTIGCIAGFLQIFTETLVNWKTGYCARNWLLNKSFCCVEKEVLSSQKSPLLTKRQEMECVNNGLWATWSFGPLPFLIFFSLSVLFALVSTLLVKHVAPMATGSGITEIKVWVSGFKYKDEFLNLSTLVVKSIALPLTISSGLSVGKEGPSVHYAACCGYVITSWLLRDALTFNKQADYLTAASGAGVAVAFGSPIGGVLFGLEEIATAREYTASALWKSFYVALGAVATLEYINPFRSGKIVLFNVTYDKDWRVQEIPVFIILGIFGGLYGKLVSKWNINYVHFRKTYLSKWPVQEVLVLVIITSSISYFNEFLKLDMTESMGILFHECQTNDNSSAFTHRLCQLDENTHMVSFLRVFCSLVIATVVRAILVVVSYGAKVPAGIFVPSMAIGATFGRALSLLVERFVSGAGVITPGAYAFLGAAATLCGITNLTLTVVVIMFELTGAFIYILPTMLVVAVTRMVLSSSGTAAGIADQMILVNGFPILEEDDLGEFMSEYTARDIMAEDLITINDDIYLSELESLIYDTSQKSVNGYPIVQNQSEETSGKKCVGYVLRRHLITKLRVSETSSLDSNLTLVSFTRNLPPPTPDVAGQSLLSFKDIANPYPVTVKPEVLTSSLFRMFRKLGCKAIMVEECDVLKGLITKKDILRFERTKREEIFGPRYRFNASFDQKLWSIVERIIQRFSYAE